MSKAVIVSAVRTAVGKAKRGSFVNVRPDDLASFVIKKAVEKAGVNGEDIDDVILGTAMPEGPQGMNLGRIASLGAGLPVSVPGITINRFCSSGLQSIALASDRINTGGAKIIVAGGVESMSQVTFGGNGVSCNPEIVSNNPEVYMSMGLTAEVVSRNYDVSREDQDKFSYQSHVKACKAIESGAFKDEIETYEWEEKVLDASNKLITIKRSLSVDEGPRADTSLEKLAKLRAVFSMGGTVTAASSSQMSDGAAAVVVMDEEEAKAKGITPIGRLLGFAVGGVAPEEMGMGPVVAVPKVLEMTGLSLSDIDLIELNEAFAAQSLAVIRKLGLDESIVNVNGGAIALGHPLGATGCKLTVQILNELKRRDKKIGLVTMCIGGGMGAAGIIERL
ncbi:MAG: acetyl-CoA C-acyltransferase [Planctomycetota bacterium]|nr:MAG: acetyl-CoA C-acyltransferase [Planctomycetota bacterium]